MRRRCGASLPRRGGGEGHGTFKRARARVTLRAVVVFGAAVLAAGVWRPSAAAFAATPAPTDLRIVPAVQSLNVRWRVSSSDGVIGFYVRWRRASGPPSWSKRERPANARGFRITGLAPEPYEVRVRAILAEGALGGVRAGVGTPLPTSEGEEREREEQREREAKEKAEREAKEKAEGEQREREEREQREGEEREHKGGEEGGRAVVGKAPVGPPTPASGWHIDYGDAFGKPLSEDHTLEASENGQGCCNNSNEVAVEQKSQARVGPEGLELACALGAFTVNGVTHAASCGGVKSDNFFQYDFATAGEWAVECDCRWPVDLGGADPGWWVFTGAQEIDFFEGWGWGKPSWATAHAGIPVIVGQGDHCACGVVAAFGFDPSAGFHRYTTVYHPSGSFDEYIDGVLRWSVPATAANAYDGLILTNALRELVQPDVLSVRSVAFWQDGAHAGQGVKGGGIAPGTTLSP